jgi:hypothetical protein
MASNTVFRHQYSALRPRAADVASAPLSPAGLVILRLLPEERDRPAGVIGLALALGFPDPDIPLLDSIERELGELMGRGLAQRRDLGWTR